MADEGIREHEDRQGRSRLVVDERFLPVLVFRWFGSPTEALVDRGQAELDLAYARARERDTPLVIISDGSAGRLPSAAVRRKISEFRHDPEFLIEVVAVAPQGNIIVRGVLSAIAWAAGDRRQHRIVGSYSQAVDIAEMLLASAGVRVPPGLRGDEA